MQLTGTTYCCCWLVLPVTGLTSLESQKEVHSSVLHSTSRRTVLTAVSSLLNMLSKSYVDKEIIVKYLARADSGNVWHGKMKCGLVEMFFSILPASTTASASQHCWSWLDFQVLILEFTKKGSFCRGEVWKPSLWGAKREFIMDKGP